MSQFDFWDREGFLEFHKGDVRIYDLAGEKHLFIGPVIYASTSERGWYLDNILHLAKGSVLEIGLGLGCASKVILANPKVNKLLTLESNEAVIEAFGRPLYNHMVIKADVYDWAEKVPKTVPLYNFIFVDHYTLADEEIIPELEELAQNLVHLVKPGGHMVFWVDENADEELKAEVKKLWFRAP